MPLLTAESVFRGGFDLRKRIIHSKYGESSLCNERRMNYGKSLLVLRYFCVTVLFYLLFPCDVLDVPAQPNHSNVLGCLFLYSARMFLITICVSVYLSICLSLCSSLCFFVCLIVFEFTCMSICLSVCLFLSLIFV